MEGGAEGFLLDSVLSNVDLVDGLSCRVVDSYRFGCPRNAVTLRMDQVYECLPLLVGYEHVLLYHFFLRNFTYYCFFLFSFLPYRLMMKLKLMHDDQKITIDLNALNLNIKS